MKNKIKEFKEAQRNLFIDFFNSEILPLLNEDHTLYYGMGVVNVDCRGDDIDSIMNVINDKVIDFTSGLGWGTGDYFMDTPNCTYRFFCILDIDTNKHEQGAPFYKCSRINLELYKYKLSGY